MPDLILFNFFIIICIFTNLSMASQKICNFEYFNCKCLAWYGINMPGICHSC